MQRILRQRRCGFFLMTMVLLLSSCATGGPSPTGAPQRSEGFFVRQQFSYLKKQLPISSDPHLNDMVARIGQRLAAAADRPDIPWEFVVFEHEAPIAFSLADGKVGVFRGILPYTQDEAGLAALLAHEMAHSLLGHPGEQRRKMITDLLTLGFGSLGEPPLRTMHLTDKPGDAPAGDILAYNRTQERAADEAGLTLMAKAGYDPAAAVTFWERVVAYNREKSEEFERAKPRLSISALKAGPKFLPYSIIHPVDDLRLQEIKRLLPRIQEHYYRPQGAKQEGKL